MLPASALVLVAGWIEPVHAHGPIIVGYCQDPSVPEPGPPETPKEAPKAPRTIEPVRDLGPAPRGATPIFDKKEREAFTKQVKDFLKLRAEYKKVVASGGADNPNFKAIDKKFKAGDAAFRKFLSPLAKKYSLDSECLGAAADWDLATSDYIVSLNEYTKGDKFLGSEQANTLREEPKSTYTRRIPKSYDPTTRSWPLLVMIQDKGKHSKQITLEEFKSPALLDGEGEYQGFVTVAIDVPDGAWEDSFKLIRAVVLSMREVRSILRVDPNRIVIGGVGEGARAAAVVARFAPHFFAGLVVKGGNPGDVRAENFINVPVYVMGDISGWTKAAEGGEGQVSWADQGKSAGVDLTVDPESKLPGLVAWLSKRVRNPYAPRTVSIVKTDKRTAASFWLHYDPDPAREAFLDARIDRNSNTIEVRTEGVTRYYLFLSDALLDLSKVVRIKTNDREWSGKLPPVFATFLDCLDGFVPLDRGGHYSVTHAVDVPRVKKE